MDYKYFRELKPERAIQGNFASGQLNFKFNVDGKNAWNPSRSYLKIKMKITRGDDTRLDSVFGVGLNMYACDNLFQQLDMRINGKSVSRWNDYVAQCSAIKHRLIKDLNERESILSTTNYAQVDVEDRINDICKDGFTQKINHEYIPMNEFGFEAIAHTYSLDLANQRLIFANGGSAINIPDVRTVFSVGDYVRFINNVAETQYERVIEVLVDRITFEPGTFAANKAAVALEVGRVATRRIRCKEDTSKSQRAEDIELIWRPPLGFFDINDELCGNYHFELTPHPESVWQKYVIETKLANKIPGDTNLTYKVEISDIGMYLYTHVTQSAISGQKKYEYTDIICNSQNLTTNSLTSKVFNINPRNHSLTLCFQESSAGDDTRYSRSKFKIQNNEELNLVRYYIQMDGITLPNPIPSTKKLESVSRNTLGINNMTQRFYENYLYTDYREHNLKYEDLNSWFNAGIFFHHPWGSGYKKSGQCLVYTNFSAPFTTNPQILLFDHYYKTLSLNMANGEVSSVNVN